MDIGSLNPFKRASKAQANQYLEQADDFISRRISVSWLVRNWIQANALVMVHGAPGAGKTFLVLDWALSIACQAIPDWHGHSVRHGAVVYLAGEGHTGLRGRIAAWKQTRRIERIGKFWVSRYGLDMNTADGYGKVTEAIDGTGEVPALIVVDTLHRFLQGDENSAQDTKTMLDSCAALMVRYGCSVLLVHHTGVAGDAQHRARGSSAWRGALDVEISVQAGRPMQVIQRKAKDSELTQSAILNLDGVRLNGWSDDDGKAVYSAVISTKRAMPEGWKSDEQNQEVKKAVKKTPRRKRAKKSD